MGYWKIKFPCGLEIEEKGIRVGLKTLHDDDYGSEEVLLKHVRDKGCLIHGKKCKANIK